MSRRKPVLLINDEGESADARQLLDSQGVEYVVYHISKFEESCCGELPSTKAPSIFAPEGLYKGIEGVRSYLQDRLKPLPQESESAYW